MSYLVGSDFSMDSTRLLESIVREKLRSESLAAKAGLTVAFSMRSPDRQRSNVMTRRQAYDSWENKDVT